jgi:predicted TIM-barrel enzyme
VNLRKEDQLRLVNILDLQRKNTEATEMIAEIVKKDLATTARSATVTDEIAVATRGIDEVARRSLATAENCTELVKEMDKKMVETFKIWNAMFEKRL